MELSDRAVFLSKYDYNKLTGKLTYKLTGVRAGREVGGICSNKGYRQCTVNYKTELIHRIIWLMEYGELPETIDHRNRDKLDNRLSNLRGATYCQNNQNVVRRDKEDGLPTGLRLINEQGICPCYQAIIKANNRTYTKALSLGTRSKDDIIAELSTWLSDKRRILHKQFSVDIPTNQPKG